MRPTLVLFALLGAAAAAACGLTQGNEQTVRGTLADVEFVAKDAYAAESTSSVAQPPPRTYSLSVVITDFDGACAAATALPSMDTLVAISVTREAEPVAAGTYDISDAGSGMQVGAVVQRTTDACQLGSVESATAGHVTIASLDSSTVRGTLSFAFPDGSVSGNFVAHFCGEADAGTDVETVPLGDAAIGDAAEGGPMMCQP